MKARAYAMAQTTIQTYNIFILAKMKQQRTFTHYMYKTLATDAI